PWSSIHYDFLVFRRGEFLATTLAVWRSYGGNWNRDLRAGFSVSYRCWILFDGRRDTCNSQKLFLCRPAIQGMVANPEKRDRSLSNCIFNYAVGILCFFFHHRLCNNHYCANLYPAVYPRSVFGIPRSRGTRALRTGVCFESGISFIHHGSAMRPLESTGALFIVFYILWALLGRQQTTITRTLPVAASVFLLLHLIVEKYRWQMIPLYILALLFGLLVILNRPFDPPRWLAITATIALIPAVALPILLPVPNVPRASGAYQVGTTIYTLTDESRAEIYSGQDEARRFKIQIWYPSKPRPSDKPAPWIARADIFSPAISDLLKLPPFFLDHLALVQTPALQDAPIAPSSTQYPLIVFSHGWKGFAAQNTVQAIQLASHGYVVVALQHTYGAVTTVFDDGTIAPNNPDALPDGEPDEIYDTAARKLANQWAGDISYALDFLAGEDQDTNSPFHKALDLTRIGVYGHSTGGGAAIQFCGTDSRCKALLGMDPFMRPVSLEVLASGTPQPSF